MQLKSALLILAFCAGSAAHAGWGRKTQVHLRTGFLSGKYTGLFSGEFKLTGALDLEVELALSHKGSFLFRFIQGMDSPDSRPFYTYAGTGARYYFYGRGSATQQDSNAISIIAEPTLRAYLGGDFGVAQVLVKSFGPTVQAVANMADLGANVGAIYQISKNFGIEAQLGLSVGYGVSSTAANGFTQRALVGLTYLF